MRSRIKQRNKTIKKQKSQPQDRFLYADDQLRMACSGLTHGPPLPVQPGPDPRVISMPRRSAL